MFKALALLSLCLFSSISFARKPAVDDFVGVPSTHEHLRPSQGKELDYLFNFQQDVTKHTEVKVSPTAHLGFRLSYLFYAFGLLCAPFALWFAVTRYLDKKKAKEVVDNLILLDKYKKQNFEPKQNKKVA